MQNNDRIVNMFRITSTSKHQLHFKRALHGFRFVSAEGKRVVRLIVIRFKRDHFSLKME